MIYQIVAVKFLTLPARAEASSLIGDQIMNLEIFRNFLLWCAVINYGLLIFGVLIITLAHDWAYRFNNKIFRLSVEQFDAINYAWVVIFKVSIILFNLVPYFALRIAG